MKILSGEKYSGEGRGRTLGFPTINVLLSDLSEEEYGVYAVKIFLKKDRHEYFGVAHFGARPTFEDARFSAEVHLFSFSELLPDGVPIEILRFIPKIRDIQRFSSVEELKDQISRDISSTKEILKGVL